MKTSCNKVKNPCKICLQAVTNKNGLQCQGACKKWAHYKCLNYTPGKISDIKAGLIKVTCPCPDCETTQPKEFLTNPPFTCSNNQCPANSIPKCQSKECPSNKKEANRTDVSALPSPDRKASKPIPTDFPNQCQNKACSNQAIRCPAVECPNSNPDTKAKPKSHSRQPARPPTPPPTPPPQAGKKPKSPNKRSNSGVCRNVNKDKCYEDSQKKAAKKEKGKEREPKETKRPHSGGQKSCPDECEKEKKKLPKYDKKQNKTSATRKPPPISDSSSLGTTTDNSSLCAVPSCTSSSRSRMSADPRRRASMVHAVQDMCTTVGKLSLQLKELMCKMMQNI
ncbi:unnamed protein product [Chrysodeixis includens]|uniref:PHD-type domain-containing protein n=1 Tax=Chrysodeixis includens TaxID=689277 RepID=A0A9P0BVG0_CHRIL|nr:unnamed protein product [Chrysodeixis includens]